MHGGVNFLFIDANTPQNKKSSLEQKSIEAKAEPTSIDVSSGDMTELAFFEFTKNTSSITKGEDFVEYYSFISDYLEDNKDEKLKITCYNNNKDLADDISRRVRKSLWANGVGKKDVVRRVRKVADSPTGKAGVGIVVIKKITFYWI